MDVDATSRIAQIVLDLPGFVLLAAGEYGGELELLVEITATVVHCHQCVARLQMHDRREHLLRDVPVAGRAAGLGMLAGPHRADRRLVEDAGPPWVHPGA